MKNDEMASFHGSSKLLPTHFHFSLLKPWNWNGWKIRRRILWLWFTMFLTLISIMLYSFQLYYESYTYYNPPQAPFTNNCEPQPQVTMIKCDRIMK
jgi:hypothetical protein